MGKNLLAIGSIISWGNKHSIVWGSGFINEQQKFKGGTIYAVRGKYTDAKLKKTDLKEHRYMEILRY